MVNDFWFMGLSEDILQILQDVRDECRYSMCPSTEEWTSRPWSIHSMNVVQPKRKAVLTHATVWMNPEGIMLSDISQTRRTNDV